MFIERERFLHGKYLEIQNLKTSQRKKKIRISSFHNFLREICNTYLIKLMGTKKPQKMDMIAFLKSKRKESEFSVGKHILTFFQYKLSYFNDQKLWSAFY